MRHSGKESAETLLKTDCPEDQTEGQVRRAWLFARRMPFHAAAIEHTGATYTAMIRNLILDMGNVLITWEPRAFALRAAGNEEDAEILNSALFDTPDWPLHDAGGINEETVLRRALDRTPNRLHSALITLFDRWPYWMAPIPGADAFTLKAREAGLRLYLLSNAGTRFPQVLRGRPFYPRFNGMMVSAHEKLSKPDPRIYRRLCDVFSLQPRECLFVDDLIQNVEGAARAGMAAHLFDGDYRKVEDKLRDVGVTLSETRT